MLLLFWCLGRGGIEGKEPAIVRYVKFAAPLDEVGKALRSVCLQWGYASFVEEGHDVRDEEEGKYAMRACKCSGTILS